MGDMLVLEDTSPTLPESSTSLRGPRMPRPRLMLTLSTPPTDMVCLTLATLATPMLTLPTPPTAHTPTDWDMLPTPLPPSRPLLPSPLRSRQWLPPLWPPWLLLWLTTTPSPPSGHRVRPGEPRHLPQHRWS